MSVTVVMPVVERIADELFARLQKLTAGYSAMFIASEVIRPTRVDGYTPKNRQIVLTFGQEERVNELDCPGNPPAVAYRQTFNIRCHVAPSEKDPTPVERYVALMAASVMQVVGDANRWHTFSELSINAEWQTREDIAGEGGTDGCNMPIAITYRVDETNPFNLRG